MSFGDTTACTVKGCIALLNGNVRQVEGDERFREAAKRTILYLFTALYVLLTLIRITLDRNINYTWEELLINYQGGFVRRGLLGEVLFQIQPYIPSFITATVLIFIAYCLFTCVTLELLDKTPQSVYWFFIFSPATFLFPIYEPSVFGRKEVFFLCAFVLTNLAYLKTCNCRIKVLLFLVLYTVAIFIHEAALFFAPLSACLLVLSLQQHTRYSRTWILISLLFYIFCLGFILWFSVNPKYDPSAVVSAWKPYLPNIGLKAALSYLDKGLWTFLVQTGRKASNFSGFVRPYIMDFFLALLPVSLLTLQGNYLEFFRYLRKDDPLLFISIIGSLLAPFFLFCFQDWGRWIYFIAVHTFIFLTMLNKLGLVSYKIIEPPTKYYSRVYLLLFAFYVFLWRMPGWR